ncbi:hypothetical protein D8674_029402 [Pyrus ussuriensis x Pyrus communis]|uniref:Uncharacterized protein n=1 Tax=Pyrus ussuriensis x Pyrus communis TaxID=2448454 RepID=A0A5N5HYY2_9ROSA|nr:hypothetical protein D8674_029402 [Pyrus ussuriensis x Pyrus communis]
MSSSGDETLAATPPAPPPAATEEEEAAAEQRVSDTDNASEQSSQEWETMARAWLCSSKPDRLQLRFHTPRHQIHAPADLCQRLIAIQNCMRLPSQEGKEENQGDVDIPHARFKRTDQWRPFIFDIADWLTENPDIQAELCSRHSKYHLMHYIKKCHMKILKRREKKKVLDTSSGYRAARHTSRSKVHKDVQMKQEAPVPSPLSVCNAFVNEAIQKYEILVELEKLLAPLFLTRVDTNK